MNNHPLKALTLILSLSLLTITQNAKANEPEEDGGMPCSFTVDGKSYQGKGSTQVFPATGEFSVLCQEPSDQAKIAQFVFRDEASARTPQTFKIVQDKPTSAANADEASLTFDNSYESDDDSSGSITVVKEATHNAVVFKDVVVTSTSKASVKLSGQVSF